MQGERLGPSLILLCIDINVPIYGYAVLFFSPAYNKNSGGSSCMDFYFSGSSIPFHVCLCASPTTILELKFRCDNTSNINLFFFCSHPLRIAWVIWALNVNMLLKILYNEYYYNLSVCYTFIHLSLVEYLNFSYWDWCYNTTNTYFFAC